MGTYRISWHGFYGVGNGYSTVDINIPPATVGVQVSLYGKFGSTEGYAGIKHFRKRLSSGQDEDVEFGNWKNWPPAIFDHISSVTLALSTFQNHGAWLIGRIDYWN
jgi:hypothetical protein